LDVAMKLIRESGGRTDYTARMSQKPQTYKNHAKVIPAFHFFVIPVLIVNVISAVVRLVNHPSVDATIAVAVAVALWLMVFFARMFALRVQDRVIRLEMRLRLRELLPPDLVSRVHEFEPGQLVALRFASDAELPALARKVLDEKLRDRKVIKQMIREWQADHLRA
jgi:hypothetical protein